MGIEKLVTPGTRRAKDVFINLTQLYWPMIGTLELLNMQSDAAELSILLPLTFVLAIVDPLMEYYDSASNQPMRAPKNRSSSGKGNMIDLQTATCHWYNFVPQLILYLLSLKTIAKPLGISVGEMLDGTANTAFFSTLAHLGLGFGGYMSWMMLNGKVLTDYNHAKTSENSQDGVTKSRNIALIELFSNMAAITTCLLRGISPLLDAQSDVANTASVISIIAGLGYASAAALKYTLPDTAYFYQATPEADAVLSTPQMKRDH